MQDWNVPLDISHQIARGILGKVRTDLIAIHEANQGWEPSPMPDDYEPSPTDHLQPGSYDSPYLALGERILRPHHLGDEVFFYDYCLRRRRRATARMYP